MRIDPSTASAEEIERMNRDWMEMQKRPPPPSSPPTPRPQTPVVSDDRFLRPVPAGFGNEGFEPNRFKDDLRAVMSNDIFPIGPGQLPTGGQFPANPYGRNPYGPSLGMGRPSYGGIGSLFSQVAYMPEDVYKTGMQRFQQYMPMLGEYGGFGQYPRPAPRPQKPVIADDTNFGGLPADGKLPPMTGGPRPDPYSTGGADAGGSTTTNQFPANQYYGMGRTGNPYGIGTGGSPYTQPYFQSGFTSPMNMGYGSNYRQGLYMPRDPYGGGYGGKGGYSPQPSSMGGKGGYGR